MAKHIAYFNLVDAMRAGRCPVCRRIRGDVHKAMESFLYESVNDSGIRDEIRRDGGLCNRHTWQLADFGDALGGAILFRDILQSLITKLAPLSRGKKLALGAIGRQVCYFCRLEKRTLELTGSTIAENIDDPEIQTQFAACALLCIPHLPAVFSLIEQQTQRKYLIDLHREKYDRLCEQMELLIYKSSYDRVAEGMGIERDSWLRAAAALVGEARVM